MQRKDIILHLVGEMVSHILEGDPQRMVVSLHQEESGLHLCILDNNEHTEEEVAKMDEALNSQKRPELAGYYGAMTGHDLLGHSRLDLLGWQIKHADVVCTKPGIKIDLWMGGEEFESHRFSIPDKADKGE